MDREERFEIERIIWETHRQLYEIKLSANLHIAFYNVCQGEDQFDELFHRRVRQKTDEDVLDKKEYSFSTKGPDLPFDRCFFGLAELARQAMENGIAEIRSRIRGKRA